MDALVPRSLDEGDIPGAVDVMAASFFHDPLWTYLVPDEAKRRGLLRRFFGFFLSVMFTGQEAFGLGEPLQAVAIWDTPGFHERRSNPYPKKALVKALFSPVFPLLCKVSKIFHHINRMHRIHAPGCHFYLVSIGVLPASQGKGLASRLIRHVLAEADARGFKTYVETMTQQNVSTYQHIGFKLIGRWDVPKTALSVWFLCRPPAQG